MVGGLIEWKWVPEILYLNAKAARTSVVLLEKLAKEKWNRVVFP